MKCPKCGTEFNEGVFCPECGTPISQPEPDKPSDSASSDTKTPTDVPKSDAETPPPQTDPAEQTKPLDAPSEKKYDVFSMIFGILALVTSGKFIVPEFLGFYFAAKADETGTASKKSKIGTICSALSVLALLVSIFPNSIILSNILIFIGAGFVIAALYFLVQAIKKPDKKKNAISMAITLIIGIFVLMLAAETRLPENDEEYSTVDDAQSSYTEDYYSDDSELESEDYASDDSELESEDYFSEDPEFESEDTAETTRTKFEFPEKYAKKRNEVLALIGKGAGVEVHFSHKALVQSFDGKTDYTFYGNIKNGKADGIGLVYRDHKLVFGGEFKKGKPCGYGIVFDSDIPNVSAVYESDDCSTITMLVVHHRFVTSGDGYIYYGFKTCRDNQSTGLEFESNACVAYEGGLKKNKRDGKGKAYSYDYDKKSASLVYEGGYKNDKPSGKGKSYYSNGQLCYDGKFKKGKYNGKGTLYNADGSVQYKGKFKDGNAA